MDNRLTTNCSKTSKVNKLQVIILTIKLKGKHTNLLILLGMIKLMKYCKGIK